MAKRALRPKSASTLNSNVPAVTQPQSLDGIVVSHLGKSIAVESDTRETIICHTRRRLERPAVGDRVKWEPCAGDGGLVLEILPRRSVILRPAANGKSRPVAANIDQMLIVVATEPECDFLLVDQLLVVCEQRGIEAHFIVNKIDLADARKTLALSNKLSVYQQLGYNVYRLSATQNRGFEDIRPCLKDRTSMLVGQSGIGKSSISNILLPGKVLATGALSASSGKGRHTTTASTLYRLPGGGELIDSPGMAIFGLSQVSHGDLAAGYREFRAYIPKCRFNDCRHRRDKDCAVRAAVELNTIDRGRYQRYLKLMDKLLLDNETAG